jgi:HSP20 family protein
MFTASYSDLLGLERGIEEILNAIPGSKAAAPHKVVPGLSIAESKDSYVIHLEVPGVAKHDVKIALVQNVLTISGERKHKELPDGAAYVRNEVWSGSFERSVQLPERINAAEISAELTDGVLSVHVPKVAEAKPREITIR